MELECLAVTAPDQFRDDGLHENSEPFLHRAGEDLSKSLIDPSFHVPLHQTNLFLGRGHIENSDDPNDDALLSRMILNVQIPHIYMFVV